MIKLDGNFPDCCEDDEISLGLVKGFTRAKVKKLKPKFFDLLVPRP